VLMRHHGLSWTEVSGLPLKDVNYLVELCERDAAAASRDSKRTARQGSTGSGVRLEPIIS